MPLTVTMLKAMEMALAEMLARPGGVDHQLREVAKAQAWVWQEIEKRRAASTKWRRGGRISG
jgi:hypothetical protein